jgi:hypothetical protein
MTVFRRFYNELDSHRPISIEPYHYGHKQCSKYKESTQSAAYNLKNRISSTVPSQFWELFLIVAQEQKEPPMVTVAINCVPAERNM